MIESALDRTPGQKPSECHVQKTSESECTTSNEEVNECEREGRARKCAERRIYTHEATQRAPPSAHANNLTDPQPYIRPPARGRGAPDTRTKRKTTK